MHRVYGTVSAGRDAPYLASDVPPVWKHGYVPPPRPSSFDLPLIHFPLVRFLPSISTRSNPPVRDLTGTQSSPVTVSLLFSLSLSLSSSQNFGILPLGANPISPFLSIDHLFGPTGVVSFPANPSSAEFKFLHSAFGEILRNTLFDLHRCRVHGVTWSVNIFK